MKLIELTDEGRTVLVSDNVLAVRRSPQATVDRLFVVTSEGSQVLDYEGEESEYDLQADMKRLHGCLQDAINLQDEGSTVVDAAAVSGVRCLKGNLVLLVGSPYALICSYRSADELEQDRNRLLLHMERQVG